MAGDLADVYTRAVHESLRQYAAWPIGEQFGLGDYGKLRGHHFVKEGNIKREFRIKVSETQSPAKLLFEFKSAGVQESLREAVRRQEPPRVRPRWA
jgi:hypothetical protein